MDHSLWALQKRGKEVQSLPISTSFQWCGIMQDRHKKISTSVDVRLFLIEAFNLVFFFTGRSTTTQLCPSHHCRSARRSWRSKCWETVLGLLLFLLFVPREILMRKWKTEVVDMMFWLGRGSIVGLISEERGHEGAIGRFGKQERFCQRSSAAWSWTRAVISDLLCN